MGILKRLLYLWYFKFIGVIVIFLCNFVFSTTTLDPESDPTTGEYYKHIYYSLQSLLDDFNSEQYIHDENVKNLLSAFETCCPNWEDQKPMSPERHPFIVVESTRKTRRRVLSKLLATSIGATLLYTIPTCLSFNNISFSSGSELKSMFYSLGVYANSYFLRTMLEKGPVLLDGYWLDQAAFHIARVSTELPPIESSVYNFPKDLIMPDLVIFLNCAEVEKKDYYKQFALKTIEFFRSIIKPEVYEFHSLRIRHYDILDIRQVIKEKLAHKFKHASYI